MTVHGCPERDTFGEKSRFTKPAAFRLNSSENPEAVLPIGFKYPNSVHPPADRLPEKHKLLSQPRYKREAHHIHNGGFSGKLALSKSLIPDAQSIFSLEMKTLRPQAGARDR